jgi:hypothetical protein
MKLRLLFPGAHMLVPSVHGALLDRPPHPRLPLRTVRTQVDPATPAPFGVRKSQAGRAAAAAHLSEVQERVVGQGGGLADSLDRFFSPLKAAVGREKASERWRTGAQPESGPEVRPRRHPVAPEVAT